MHVSSPQPTRLRIIDQALIAQVRDRIVQACQPQAVILFGSSARNAARYTSDLNLIVIMDRSANTSRRQQARNLHSLFEGWLISLDIHCVIAR